MPAQNTPTAGNAQARSNNFTRDLFAWLNQVKADSDLPPSAFKVAFEIGQYINRKSGEAWPSTGTIGKGIAMSKATVIDMITVSRRATTSTSIPVPKGAGIRTVIGRS